MLASNPIWFREQQAWKSRRARLPWWRRHLRYATLPLIWAGTALLSLCLLLISGGPGRFTPEHPVREALGAALIFSICLQVAYLVFRSLIGGASALVREQELQTMDTLLSSPLPVRDLLIGKWLTAAGPLLIEATLVLPIGLGMGMVSHFSTVAAWQIGDAYVLSLSIVVALTSAGLLLSTRSRNSGRAAIHAVLAGLGLMLGSYLCDLLVQCFEHGEKLYPILCWINPYSALYSIGTSDYNWMPQTWTNIHGDLWQVCSTSYLLLAILAMYAAGRRLRHG